MPRKKRRRADDFSRPDPGMTEDTSTFFESLPTDATTHLFRFLSDEPNRDDWASHVNSRALTMANRILRHAVRDTYRAVCDHGGIDGEGSRCHDCSDDFLSAPKLHFYDSVSTPLKNRACTHRLIQIIDDTLPLVTSARLSRDLSGPDAGALARRLPGLRELSISVHDIKVVQRVLAARGRNLHLLALSLTRPEEVRLIVNHCTKLRCLVLHGHCQTLLQKVLIGAGRRLKALDLWVDDPFDLLLVRLHCPALDTLIVFLNCEEHFEDQHAVLLASYGAQLRIAQVANFTEEEARLVSTSCPNVQINVNETFGTEFSAFGRALSKVFVRHKTTPSDMLRALACCPSVEEIDLTGFLDEHIPNSAEFLDLSLPSLTTVNLFRSPTKSNVLAQLARCTGNIRRITLELDIKEVAQTEGFNTLIASNPLLTHIEIDLGNLDKIRENHTLPYQPIEQDTETICKLVQLCTKCEHLRELVLESKFRIEMHNVQWIRLPQVRNVLQGKLRYRRLYVLVLGKSYLPAA